MNPNPTGLPQSQRPSPNSGMISPNDSQYVSRAFFVYEVDTVATIPLSVAAPTANLTFNVAKDSDFFWTKFGVHAVVGTDGTTVSAEQLAEVSITIQNTTTGRNYMSNPVPVASISGNGRLPFILPMVTLWESLSTIAITLQNTSDNTDYSAVKLSFIGIKAFFGQR